MIEGKAQYEEISHTDDDIHVRKQFGATTSES